MFGSGGTLTGCLDGGALSSRGLIESSKEGGVTEAVRDRAGSSGGVAILINWLS